MKIPFRDIGDRGGKKLHRRVFSDRLIFRDVLRDLEKKVLWKRYENIFYN